MNPSNPKTDVSSGVDDGDRLSNLPEDIIHHIFSFLGIIDIVRARSVSKNWKSLWLSMPYLNLFFPYPSDPRRYKNMVNWVLLSQISSTDIQTLDISCFHPIHEYIDDCYDDDADTNFTMWMSAAAIRNVQDLRLYFVDFEVDRSGRLPYESMKPIELPICLVTCESLVNISIERCILHPPTHAAPFSRLKSLELKSVYLSDNILFGNFISDCLLLENLILNNCAFHIQILHISSTSLKNLVMYEVGFWFHWLETKPQARYPEFKLACPNLVSFTFYGDVIWTFSFEDLNSLQNLRFESFDLYGATHEESLLIMRTFLKGITKVKVLELSLYPQFCYPFVDPTCFSTSFCNLTSLTLEVGMQDCDMHLIINFLNCSPNLRVLSVSFYWCHPVDRWMIPDKAISCLTYHLKAVELDSVEGSENELDFIRFLLRNGHVLQEMIIRWSRTMLNAKEEIISKIMTFSRSSSNIGLTFLESK